MSNYVVYAYDEEATPIHFLATADTREEANEKMEKWWKAFDSGEKAKPEYYTGLSFKPVSNFEDWKAPEDVY